MTLKELRDKIAALSTIEHPDYNPEFIERDEVLALVDAAIAQQPGGWPADRALIEGPDGVPKFVPLSSLDLIPRDVS